VSKKIMVQGHGPSKVNRDPAARSAYEALKGLHVGGKAIEDLPEDMVIRLCYEHTDEAIAKRNQGKEPYGSTRVQNLAGDCAPVTATDFDRQVEERRDFRGDENLETWEAPDPMKELAEKHVSKGMVPKFLSPSQIDRRGTRGYEIVKDSKGQPVKVGQMVLGQIPETKARARNEHFRKQGGERLAAVETNFKEQQRQLGGE
jgi:hypothetical protein